MPIYKYVCPKCACEIKEIREIEDRDKPVKCPRCGAQMQRVIGNIGVKYKAKGFYSTGK